MRTASVSHKEFTITIEFSIHERYLVVIIVAMEGQFKLVETKTGALFRVSFCLFQLADHTVVHRKLLLKFDKTKRHAVRRVPFFHEKNLCDA